MGKPCLLEWNVACTPRNRFRHVSNGSFDKCDILMEKENIKSIAARFRRRPKLKLLLPSAFHIIRGLSCPSALILIICQSHPRYENRIITSTRLLQLCSQTMFTIGVVGKCDGCVETQQEAAPFSKAENDRQEHFFLMSSADSRGRTEVFIRLEITLRMRICC
jgi:hypothetical protein